jgi:hypothetical protein
MVKYLSVLLLLVAFAAPAFAQDDVPQFEISMGYGNTNLKGVPGRHSGFVTQQTFNLNSWLGVENYIAYYGFGTDPTYGKTQLITDMFGGKFTYRAAKVNPYAVAGIGGGFLRFPQSGVGTNNAFSTRYGGGLDVPFKEGALAVKLEVSRQSFHFGTWTPGTAFSAGLVIKVGSF